MQFTMSDLWGHMGVPALVVAGLLLLMGLAALTVFIERLLAIRSSRLASERFAAAIGRSLRRDQIEMIVSLAAEKAYAKADLARLVREGLTAYREVLASAETSTLSVAERTRRRVERHLEVVNADLRKGMGLLASVGSTAPFVGLLGTVVGIISAFQGIAATGSGGLAAVSAGISEALIETALGLAVAIPAVLAFNYLSSLISREEQFLNHAAGDLVDAIEGWEGQNAEAALGTARRAEPRQFGRSA
jgi:biopolymer transport protein ExbB